MPLTTLRPAYTIALLTWLSCVGAGVWLWLLPLPITIQWLSSGLLIGCLIHVYRHYWCCCAPYSVVAMELATLPTGQWHVALANGQHYTAAVCSPRYITAHCIILHLNCFPLGSAPSTDFVRTVLLLTPRRLGQTNWHRVTVNCHYISQ